jgi:hypothetical protein
MSKKNLKMTVVAVLIATSGLARGAFAQDAEQQPDEAIVYGNLHLGTYDDIFVDTNPLTQQVGLEAGGKIAIAPLESPFGFQFDAEGNGTSSNLQAGGSVNTGTQTDLLAVAHGTYALSDQVKFGAFGGFEEINRDITSPAGSLPPIPLASGPVRLQSDFTYGSVGVEGLYAFTPENWMQARAGFIKPMTGKATVTLTNTGLSSTANGDYSQYTGFEIGLGARFGLAPNFSLRTDANFISIQKPTGGYTNDLNTLVTGQYAFNNSPLSLYAQVGYERAYDNLSATDILRSRGGITWSFGGPTESTKSKLFRSAGFGGVFN